MRVREKENKEKQKERNRMREKEKERKLSLPVSCLTRDATRAAGDKRRDCQGYTKDIVRRETLREREGKRKQGRFEKIAE